MNLRVVTKAESIREDVIAILREALGEAERGEVAEIIVILKQTDGHWKDRRSATLAMSDAIGKIEIVKQAWIGQYLTECSTQTTKGGA